MKNTKVTSKHFPMIVWISLLVFIPLCCSEKVKIIKSRASLRSNGFKETAEAELSLFTEPLGFINDEYLQKSSPTHTFFKKYVRLTKWNEAVDAKITENYLVGHGVKLCTAYLKDPIFGEHGITFYEPETTTPDWQFVRFRYSSRKLALIKVVKCPIQRHLRKGGAYKSRLYFQEIRHSDRLNKSQRGYFVFANSEGMWGLNDPLELLMYTTCSSKLPPLDETGQEVAFSRPTWADREGFTVQFDANKLLQLPQGDLCNRLFGEEAEVAFLTKQYGFVNHNLPLWRKKKFIQIMDRLKTGYEVNAAKLQQIKQRDDPLITCKNYINNNNRLRQRGIRITKDLPARAKVGWVSTSVKFLDSAILAEGDRKLELLQCPVMFNTLYLFILPVHYINTAKTPQVFTFSEIGRNTNKVNPIILSPVNDEHFEPSPRVLPTDQDQKDKNTKTITDEPKVESSSYPPPPNLMDADIITTETTSDPAKPGPSRLSSIADLIDFTDPSPPWKDIPFTYTITENWEKFDSEEDKEKN